MSSPPRGTAADYSKGSATSRAPAPGLRWASRGLVAAAVAGPLLLVGADLTTLIEVTVEGRTTQTIKGGDHHSYAMLVLGLAALPMAYGALRMASRPAMAALAVLGAIAAGLALIGDLPDVNQTGAVGTALRDAQASPGTGFYLETLGAVLTLLAGVGALLLNPPDPPEPRRRAAAD